MELLMGKQKLLKENIIYECREAGFKYVALKLIVDKSEMHYPEEEFEYIYRPFDYDSVAEKLKRNGYEVINLKNIN